MTQNCSRAIKNSAVLSDSAIKFRHKKRQWILRSHWRFYRLYASACAKTYSHSIVAGGLPEMSYTTREMPSTSLMMRLEQRPRKSYGRCAQCAVMKSMVSTARRETTQSLDVPQIADVWNSTLLGRLSMPADRSVVVLQQWGIH